MKLGIIDSRVLTVAQEIVNLPTTSFGYSDIGDVIVSHLRGEKIAEEAIEMMNRLAEDYARKRRRDAAPPLPVMVFMGMQVSAPRVMDALNLPGKLIAWGRHIKLVQHDRDLDIVRGLRGLWWIDWGATQTMRNFAAVQQFKKATVEECDAAIRAYIGETK